MRWRAHEIILMALRYCYYVLNVSVISDQDYDAREAQALRVAPLDSPLRRPGSSNQTGYTKYQSLLAEMMVTYHTQNQPTGNLSCKHLSE